ncbi:MAG: ribosome maturation factor RimM [Cyanobacteria bacterium M5B4]|nr:MAG: ribosome maturation factor RimM [Cyanobacteria bacterium M5B4]
MEDLWVVVGKIVGTQGLKGEVRIFSYSDFPERFLEPGQRWIRANASSEPRPIGLVRGYAHTGKQGVYIVKLEEVNNCEQAEKLRNFEFLVPAHHRPHLQADEFYVADLIDCQVLDHDNGKPIGVVTAVVPAGNDLLEIKTVAKTYLVPFVRELVPIVDLVAKKIEVKPIEGLFD